jgi:mRNA interferase RelE/StbE
VDRLGPGIKRSAARELEQIEPRPERRRIVERIRALAAEPRPSGVQKLAGRSSLLRVREGDYRIHYKVHDSDRRTVVIEIGHRREVYR